MKIKFPFKTFTKTPFSFNTKSFRGGEIITYLEINTRTLKLVQARQGRQNYELLNLAAKKCLSSSEEDIIKTLRTLIRDMKIKPSRLITSIPRHLTTIRYLELPSTKEAEIKEMAHLQAVKLIPYTKEETIVDYQIIETNENGYSKVMIVIVHRDIVDKHLSLLHKVNLSPESIRLDSLAISNFYIYDREKKELIDEAPVALVDIKSNLTNFEIVYQGKLVFSRSFSIGELPLSDAKEENIQEIWKNKLIEDIERSFTAYDKEKNNRKIAKIILGREALNFPGLDKDIEKTFSLPLETINPLADFNYSLSPPKSEGKEVSFWSTLGLLLTKDTDLNFLPARIQNKKAKQTKNKEFLFTAGVFVLAIILASAIFTIKLSKKEKHLAYLNREIVKTNPIATQVNTKKNQIQIIKEQLGKKNYNLDILRELYRIFPREVYLNSLTFDKDESLTLKGASSIMLSELITTLEQSAYFENVELKPNRETSTIGKYVHFHIQCSLIQPVGRRN